MLYSRNKITTTADLFIGLNTRAKREKFILPLLIKSKLFSRAYIRSIKQALSLQKTKCLNILKKLSLSKQLTSKILNLLMKANLSLKERKIVIKVLKLMVINLFKKPFCNPSLDALMAFWYRIPYAVRLLLVALNVLKIEMIHRFLLDLEKDKKRLFTKAKLKDSVQTDAFLKKNNFQKSQTNIILNKTNV